jgi:hypothetical protein
MKFFDVSSHPGGSIELPGFGTVIYDTSDNPQRTQPAGTAVGMVMHWSGLDLREISAAAIRMRLFAGYHYMIADNGTEAAVIRTLKPSEKGQHAWGRNTGLIGVAYAATADSSQDDYGEGAPTERQHQAMHYLGGELCAWRHLDPHGTVNLVNKASNDTSIWTVEGTHDFPVIMSHQTLAQRDGYASARWDTGKLCEPDRGGIQWVYDQLKAGKLQFQLKDIL